MLVGLYGFANTGVHDVKQRLEKAGIAWDFFQDKETPIDENAQVILAANAAYLPMLTEMLAEHQDYVLVLFDVPVRLDGIKGINMVDVKEKKKSFYYDFQPAMYQRFVRMVKKDLEHAKEFEVNTRSPNVIPALLRSTASSTLQRLQSWKYAIHPVEVRDEAMAALLEWFVKPDISVEQVKENICLILDKENAADILFQDDRYLKLKDAVMLCLQAKAKGVSIVSETAKERGLSAFDIRYIMNAATTQLLYKDEDLYDIYAGMKTKHKAKEAAKGKQT